MRDGRVDLDALVHRSGVHHRRARAHGRDARLREAPGPRVLADRGEQPGLLALALEPEGDDAIGAVERPIDVGLVADPAREIAAPPRRRQESGRAGQRDAGAERDERVDVAARDAAVEDVADDDDPLPREIPELRAQRVRVEQALGRMCVSAVARIDHGRADALRDEIRRPRRPVPYDEDITAEGLERARGVEERFTLLDRRARRRDVHDVGRERLRRELEGDARACRGLGEEEDHRAAAERRRAADRPREDLEHPVRGIEDVLDLLA